MKSTKRSGRPQRVSVEEALQILQSAIAYCQMAGLPVRGANSDSGLTLIVPGVAYTHKQPGNGMVLRVAKSRPAHEQQAKRVVIYARSAVSNGDDVARQLALCKVWAAERGYTVSEAYVDGGSGNDPRLPRRAQAIAMAAVEGAMLVCVEPSRLARNADLLAQILAECERRGVVVCFVEQSS
jgi:predicted site-specific integrase-resolvase